MRMRRVGIPLGGTCEHRRAIPLPMADLGQRKGRYNLRSAGGQKDHELEVIKQQPQRSQQKPNLEAVEGCESDDLNEEEWEKIETEVYYILSGRCKIERSCVHLVTSWEWLNIQLILYSLNWPVALTS